MNASEPGLTPLVGSGGTDIDNQKVLIQTVAFAGSLLAAVSLLLRVIERRARRIQLRSEDYWAALALVPQFSYTFFLSLYGTRRGLGLHYIDAPPSALPSLARTMFSAQIGFAMVFASTRMSVLALLNRTIRRFGAHLICTYLVMAMVIGWCIIILCMAASECMPRRYLSLGGYSDEVIRVAQCTIGSKPFLERYFLSAMVVDLFTVALPLPLVFTSWVVEEETSVILVSYALAGFVLGISIFRTRALVLWEPSDGDPTWSVVGFTVFMMLESSLSAFFVNWPFFSPTLDMIISRTFSAISRFFGRLSLRVRTPGFLRLEPRREEQVRLPVMRDSAGPSSLPDSLREALSPPLSLDGADAASQVTSADAEALDPGVETGEPGPEPPSAPDPTPEARSSPSIGLLMLEHGSIVETLSSADGRYTPMDHGHMVTRTVRCSYVDSSAQTTDLDVEIASWQCQPDEENLRPLGEAEASIEMGPVSHCAKD